MEDTPAEEIIQQLTPKRFSVTANFYIYASDQQEAERLAQRFRESQDLNHDNKCVILDVSPRPFGSV